ncbi:hypothetical protein JD844_013956 [Phrynosoma platyrhinos]|uniref:Uncharacterized protein n=1 Tax=Phrynosoma platyrhinos TaxID=52577 RepID=A0ABQ7TLH8_PHRPL|nr:hypothetical protein JD844_013956 [Phrynosoma platyrhinos]
MQDTVPPEQHVPQDFPASPATSDETQIPAEAGQDDPSPGPANVGYASQQSLANDSRHGAVDRGGPVRRGGRLTLEDNEVFPERRARRGELIALTLMEDSRREGRLNRKLFRRLHNDMLKKMEKVSTVLEKLENSEIEDIQNTERHRRRMLESMDSLMDLAKVMLQEQRQRNNYQAPGSCDRTLGCKSVPSSVLAGRKKKSKTNNCTPTPAMTVSQVLIGETQDEGAAPSLVPCTQPTQESPQQTQPEAVGEKTKRVIKKKQIYSPS